MAEMGRTLGATEDNWTRATAMGTGIQVLGIALKKSVDTKLITEAAREVMGGHSILRSRIVESKSKLVYEVPTGPITPDLAVLPWPASLNNLPSAILSLPADDGNLGQVLNHVVRQELNTSFPNAAEKFTGPTAVFQVHVYAEPSQGRSIIVLRFISGAIDRPAACTVSQSFITALNAIVDGQAPKLPEAPGKNELLPALEDLVPKGKSKGFFQKGLDTVGYVANSSKFALLPFHSGFEGAKISDYKTDILSYTVGKDGTTSLMAACEKQKTTPAAALSAAFIKAAAQVEDFKAKKQTFSFTTVVDLRSYFDPAMAANALGNYTGGLSQDESVKADADFWELARSVSNATQKELDKGRHFSELSVMNMLFAQVLKRPSLTLKSSLRTSLLTIFAKTLDSRWKDTQKLELAGTFGPFASMHGAGPCFCIGEALLEGPELTVSVVYATPVYAREQMDALANSSLQILKAATKL